MDELRAVELAKVTLSYAKWKDCQRVEIDVEVLRALLARAMRPHD